MFSQFFENQPNKICSHLSEKASKGRFLKPEKLQNHSKKGKGKEKKKERGEEKEEKRKTKWLHSFFIIATLAIVFGQKKLLDAKGPFCNNAIKNLARRSCEMSSIDAKWPEMTPATLKWDTLKDWQNSLETF